jgi:uroporphyrinogen-III synthase
VTAPSPSPRRVIVTRASDQIEPLATRLHAAGFEPVAMALIDIVDPSDGGDGLRSAIGRLDSFDWLVVSSPNGAVRVSAALEALRVGRPLVAAVGTSTATTLTVPVDLIPQRQIAEGLLAVFPSGSGRVLLAQAEHARPALAEGLIRKGWTVDVVAAYRTVARTPTVTERATAHTADAVLFASGSAARAWVDVFGTSAPPVIAIGPATAEVAQALGLKVAAIAADHSLDGLVKCLMAYFLEEG